MPLADSIKHPMQELKGNWIEPKLASILGDSKRAITAQLETNLGVAMGKSAGAETISETAEILQGFVRNAIADAVTHSPKHGIRIDESVKPAALALSPSGKEHLESTLAGIEESAQPVIRKALKAGLQAALKGIQDARAKELGATEVAHQR